MNPTTVGVIGAGGIASRIHLPVLRTMDEVRVVWLTDSNVTTAELVAGMHGVRYAPLQRGLGALPPADLVVLAIPLHARTEYLDFYEDTACGLLLEKPLACDAAAHRKIISSFADYRVSVGYQRRFYSTTALIRGFIDSGTLGMLRRIVVSEGGRVTRTDGEGEYQGLPVSKGGGIVKNLGCHSLDLAIWLTQAKRFSIHSNRLDWDGLTDRGCCAQIDLLDGPQPLVQLDFSVSWISRMQNTLTFEFEGGKLRCPVAPSDHVDLLSPSGRHVTMIPASTDLGATTSYQAFYLEWRITIDALNARTAQPISAASTLLCAEMMDALLVRDVSEI